MPIRGFDSVRDNEAEADRAADAAGRVTGGGDAPTPATLPHAPAPRGVRSPGRPLPQAQRRSLEQAYGWDLGSLRLQDAPAERG
ncbi:MAG: hypothetical protein ACXWJA_15600, partial [Caldimonas sp.]